MYIFRILLLGRGLYIVHEAGRRQWSGVAKRPRVAGVGDGRLTGGGLLVSLNIFIRLPTSKNAYKWLSKTKTYIYIYIYIASCGGRGSQAVGRVFLKRADVFLI